MDFTDHIVRNPTIMLGKPTIKGTRITVELILRKFANGFALNEILESYPHLTRDQIFAALGYAAEKMANEEVIEAH
ncbi:MAG: DUF433 domain-containing protein [Cyclobacteriaceae bacterium]